MNRPSLLVFFLAVLPLPFLWAQDEPGFDGVPTLEGEGLSIVASTGVTQQVRVVTKDEIDQAQAQDVPDLLEKTLGLNLVRNGGFGNQAGISLRGFGSGRVAILVDGVPVNSPQSGVFDLGQISVGSLERIEVVEGGSDTKYNVSGAIGGVINLITVKKPRPGYTVSGSVSNLSAFPDARGSSWFDTQKADLHFGASGEGLSGTLDLNADRAANRYAYRTDADLARWWTGNGVVDVGAAAALTADLPADLRFRVTGSGYLAQKDIPGPEGSSSPGRQTDLDLHAAAFLTAATVGTEALGTDLILAWGRSDLGWTDPTTTTVHRLQTLTGSNRWTWAGPGGLQVDSAVDGDGAWLDSDTLGSVVTGSGGLSLTLRAVLGDGWDLVPSLKAVVTGGQDLPILVPKVGLVHRTGDWTVKGNGYRTFKLPTINERWWPLDAFAEGNPGLRPEDGFGADLVVEGPLGPGLSLETSGYATWHQDAILWQPSGGRWRPENIGRALYLGSTSSVKGKLTEALRLTGTYAFLMTWVLSDGLTWDDDRRMPYQPVHTLSVGLEYGWKSGSLAAQEHYETERYTTTANVTRLAPFLTLDLLYRQDLAPSLSTFVTVRNAFNQTYSTAAGYPMPGGSVTAGLSFRYGGKGLPRVPSRRAASSRTGTSAAAKFSRA